MTRKIIVLTTDGHSSEDGSVYYSLYYIVESDTLKFDEDVFHDEQPRDPKEFEEELTRLGYTFEEPDHEICILPT